MTFTTAEFIAWRAELRRKLTAERQAEVDAYYRLCPGKSYKVEEPPMPVVFLKAILTRADSYEQAERHYRRAIAPRA